MRGILSTASAVMFLSLSIEPGVARQAGDPAKKKPQPQTQKEIAELQAQVSKLAAEFAVLWETGKPWPQVTAVEGSVVWFDAGKGMPRAMSVVPGEPGHGVGIFFTKDTKVYYSDNKPAKLSDLKVGQLVRIGVRVVDPTQPAKFEADVVFIEKSVREIVGAKDMAAIAKEVDFATEYLMLYRWTGWSGYAEDRVWFTVKEGKEGPVVEIHLVRPKQKAGMAKVVEQPESRLYVIAKNARASESPLLGKGTKITNAKELAKAFPATK
jgi:hypothetical protein